MSRKIWLAFTAFALLSSTSPSLAKDNQAAGANAVMSYDSRFHPVIAKHGMVSTQERLAAKVGRDILVRGGNAVDAAVATGSWSCIWRQRIKHSRLIFAKWHQRVPRVICILAPTETLTTSARNIRTY